jgi:hypothetical protein
MSRPIRDRVEEGGALTGMVCRYCCATKNTATSENHECAAVKPPLARLHEQFLWPGQPITSTRGLVRCALVRQRSPMVCTTSG